MPNPAIFHKQAGWTVWESELSELVSLIYGRPWRLQQGEELGQNTYLECRVLHTPQDPEEDWPDGFPDGEQLLQDWLNIEINKEDRFWKMDFERNHYLPYPIILWDLQRKGIIEPGDYLIKVWW